MFIMIVIYLNRREIFYYVYNIYNTIYPSTSPPTPHLQRRKPKQKQSKNPLKKSEEPSALQPTKAYSICCQ